MLRRDTALGAAGRTISLQPTGLSVKHSAREKSRMLATEARG
jgi:hypothetical protein